jgi:hypothetical protein
MSKNLVGQRSRGNTKGRLKSKTYRVTKRKKRKPLEIVGLARQEEEKMEKKDIEEEMKEKKRKEEVKLHLNHHS